MMLQLIFNFFSVYFSFGDFHAFSTLPLPFAVTDVHCFHNLHGSRIIKIDGRTGFGSDELLARVLEICPRLHLFGHIHSSTGIHAGKYTAFSNGSVVDDEYMVVKCGNKLAF